MVEEPTVVPKPVEASETVFKQDQEEMQNTAKVALTTRMPAKHYRT